MGKIRKKTVIIVLTVLVLIFLVLAICAAWKFIKAETQIKDPISHVAYAGYLSIPSQDTELPCIEADASNYALAEMAIDKMDCGALIWYPYGRDTADTTPGKGEGRWMIGDHNFQGFDTIMNCQIGDNVFFHRADGRLWEHAVIEVFEGYIEEGIPKNKEGKQFIHDDKYDLILMTCYPKADVPAARKDRRFYVCLELISE